MMDKPQHRQNGQAVLIMAFAVIALAACGQILPTEAPAEPAETAEETTAPEPTEEPEPEEKAAEEPAAEEAPPAVEEPAEEPLPEESEIHLLIAFPNQVVVPSPPVVIIMIGKIKHSLGLVVDFPFKN